MAIIVKTSRPGALLAAIKQAIDAGSVDTWSYDADGDFTHTPAQWRNKAWLRPSLEGDELHLTTVAPKETKITVVVYAVFHGRFIEMLLSHFDKQFDTAEATALPSHGDSIGS